MDDLTALVSERLSRARAIQPEVDASVIGVAIVETTSEGKQLDEVWQTFSSETQTILTAHGHWKAWDARAHEVAGLSAAQGQIALFELMTAQVMRSVLQGHDDMASRVQHLENFVVDDGDRLLYIQLQAELRRHQGESSVDVLMAGVHLAQRMGIAAREVHFLHLLARDTLEIPGRARQYLETVDGIGIELKDALLLENRLLNACVALIDDELDTIALLVEPFENLQTSHASVGCLMAIALVARIVDGGEPPPERLLEVRRELMGTTHANFLQWVERVVEKGRAGLHPLPFATVGCLVESDGSGFKVGRNRQSLEDSPLARVLVQQLSTGPKTPDALIDAIWPEDAASFSSLKNRLHSLVRVLRRRGLGERLVYREGVYALERVIWTG